MPGTHSVCQALCGAYIMILEDDKFLEFVRTLQSSRTQQLAKMFARTFLRCHESPDGECLMPLPMQEHRFLRNLTEAFKHAADLSRMILCFLEPADYGLQSAVVFTALDYRGRRVFHKALKNILTKEPPQSATTEQKEQAKYVLGLVKDIQRTAASLPAANGAFQRLRTIVKQKHPEKDDLKWAVEQQKYLLENLRAGQMNESRVQLAKHIVNAARFLYMGDTVEGVEASWVSWLQVALKSHNFQKVDSSCVEVESKLTSWATKHNAQICKANVCTMLKTYVGDAEGNADRIAAAPFPVEDFTAALSKCKPSQFGGDSELIQGALAYVFKAAIAKVALTQSTVKQMTKLCYYVL